MSKREELLSYFEGLPEETRKLAEDTIDEYLFFQGKLEELKRLPLIAFSKSNPALQKTTAAGKLVKEYSQVLDAKRGTLLRILNRTGGDEADEIFDEFKKYE